MVDLANVHPIFGGRWHRVWFERFPEPGEQIVTYCGVTEIVEFAAGVPEHVRTCWGCDLVHRRHAGIPVLPDHPGLRAEV